MEHIPIIGGNHEEKDKAQKELIANFNEIKTDVWGNLEKTEEQLKWIDMVNRFIAVEMEELGITEFTPISVEQVRFVDEFWSSAVPVSNADSAEGLHHALYRTISVNLKQINENIENKAVDKRLKQFSVLLHEALHEKSFVKYDIRGEKIKPYRVGYNLMKEDLAFNGFNEGVTDLLTLRLLDMHRDEIKDEFGIDLNTDQDKNDKNSIWNYVNRKDVAILVSNIYEGSSDTLWKGYFTGQMMHLREIERKYGKDSLKLLALLDADIDKFGKDKAIKIHNFFDEETTDVERSQIKAELLDLSD